MLEKADSLLLHKLVHHVTENRANGIESLVSLADVGEANVIQEDLLDNEDGNRLAQLRSGLHDTEAERDDFGGEKKIDDLGGVIFDQGTNDTERGKA